MLSSIIFVKNPLFKTISTLTDCITAIKNMLSAVLDSGQNSLTTKLILDLEQLAKKEPVVNAEMIEKLILPIFTINKFPFKSNDKASLVCVRLSIAYANLLKISTLTNEKPDLLPHIKEHVSSLIEIIRSNTALQTKIVDICNEQPSDDCEAQIIKITSLSISAAATLQKTGLIPAKVAEIKMDLPINLESKNEQTDLSAYFLELHDFHDYATNILNLANTACSELIQLDKIIKEKNTSIPASTMPKINYSLEGLNDLIAWTQYNYSLLAPDAKHTPRASLPAPQLEKTIEGWPVPVLALTVEHPFAQVWKKQQTKKQKQAAAINKKQKNQINTLTSYMSDLKQFIELLKQSNALPLEKYVTAYQELETFTFQITKKSTLIKSGRSLAKYKELITEIKSQNQEIRELINKTSTVKKTLEGYLEGISQFLQRKNKMIFSHLDETAANTELKLTELQVSMKLCNLPLTLCDFPEFNLTKSAFENIQGWAEKKCELITKSLGTPKTLSTSRNGLFGETKEVKKSPGGFSLVPSRDR